jgi:hypothetical protein
MLSDTQYHGLMVEDELTVEAVETTAIVMDREMDRSSTDELPAQDDGMEDGVIVDNKAHRAFHYDDRRHLPCD